MASNCGINLQKGRLKFQKIQKEDVRASQHRGVFWKAGLCLGLMCILQATLNIVLRLHSDPQAENNELEACNNQTIKTDELKTSYNILTLERDKLLINYKNLNEQKDDILIRFNNVTKQNILQQNKIKQLEDDFAKITTRYFLLSKENNEILKERDSLQHRMDAFATQDARSWMSFGTSLYYISVRRSWTESRQDCRDKEADLVIINSKEEQDFINKQLGNSPAWIGLSHSNAWKWVDGTPMSIGYRINEELSSYGRAKKCAVTVYQADSMQHWSANNCNERFVWICEKNQQLE